MGGLEVREGKPIYKRRAASEAKLTTAIERFMGDLLRVRTGTMAPSNVYRVIGRSGSTTTNVKYDLFTQVLDGLKSLGLVLCKGQSRYRRRPSATQPLTSRRALLGHEQTDEAAARHGIHGANVSDHFAPSHQRTRWS